MVPRGPSSTETPYICINRDYDKEALAHHNTMLISSVCAVLGLCVCVSVIVQIHMHASLCIFGVCPSYHTQGERAEQICMEAINATGPPAE